MARKLLLNITKSQEQLPSSLFIAGIHNVDKHPTFAGGFADVYRAMLGKNHVALKRLRVFTSATQSRGKFCREAVIWKNLRHRFILPFLGVDRVTFSPFLCMVSPWMKNGTILKYLSESARGRAEVLQLLLEIAQGLEYLHSVNIVHGDLRG
ncbi:kinase-like domain-containing protein, partial [Mycena pura]